MTTAGAGQEGWLVVVDLPHVLGEVVTDACAGAGEEEHERALRVMGGHAPLGSSATTDEVLARA
ncbi:hypothetical protein ABC795_17190 [Blastococcus sp. HT6-30]|uniref:hypothetical protein n=1 Tax=Blastococcus sp. HT6-30 TaxID=3144843 RepID=UPI00321ADBF4